VNCVLRAGIFRKHSECSLQTCQALSLDDTIRNRAKNCKYKSERILPISFCLKLRLKFVGNSNCDDSDEGELEGVLEES